MGLGVRAAHYRGVDRVYIQRGHVDELAAQCGGAVGETGARLALGMGEGGMAGVMWMTI